MHELAGGFDVYWNNGWSFPVAAAMEQRSRAGSADPVSVDDALRPEMHQEQLIQHARELGVELRILTNPINSNNRLTAHSASWAENWPDFERCRDRQDIPEYLEGYGKGDLHGR